MSGISGVINPYNNVKVDGNQQTQANDASSQVEVKAGSTIQGKVVSISDTPEGSVATINVGEGVINAKLSEDMGLREGQTLNFLVRGTGSNGTTITPLYENISPDQSTLKALNAAGIQVNNDTIQMVKEMMEAGLPIDKNSLLEMSKNLNNFPNSNISTMVEMKSLNIPITDNNIEQFNNYKNYEHQVIKDMANIIDGLSDAYLGMEQSGNVKGAVSFFGEVLKAFSDSGQNVEQAGVSAESASAANPQTVMSETLSGESATNGAQNTDVLPKEMLEAEQASNTQNQAGAFEGKDIQQNITEQSSATQNSKNGVSNDIEGKNPILQNADVNNNPSLIKNLSGEFLDNLRNVNVSEETIKFLSNQNSSVSDSDMQKLLFKELANAFENSNLSDNVEVASWKKLFSSEEYNKLLKENIKEQWLLKPGDVEKKENVDALYQKLGNQAKALAQLVNNTLGNSSPLAQAANNLNNNLDFMNQLNQMFQYVQLPLQMTGQNVHGDLYVYQNKHKKPSEDGSVSAVLHLDMENLGPVDVFIKLLNSKVTTNFYVADDSVIDLINENIHILNERLEKKGYSMQVTCKLHTDIDGDDAAIDEMLDVSKTPLLSTASFDARA